MPRWQQQPPFWSRSVTDEDWDMVLERKGGKEGSRALEWIVSKLVFFSVRWASFRCYDSNHKPPRVPRVIALGSVCAKDTQDQNSTSQNHIPLIGYKFSIDQTITCIYQLRESKFRHNPTHTHIHQHQSSFIPPTDTMRTRHSPHLDGSRTGRAVINLRTSIRKFRMKEKREKKVLPLCNGARLPLLRFSHVASAVRSCSCRDRRVKKKACIWLSLLYIQTKVHSRVIRKGRYK